MGERVVPWLRHLKGNVEELREHFIDARISRKSLCPLCRGPRRLCGKPVCPVTLQYYAFMRLKRFQDVESVHGNSPPSVFVGRHGYPKVSLGPMVPPVVGDTSIYDYPEMWLDKSLEDILGFRSSLIHGRFRVDVMNPGEVGRNYDRVLEMALSSTPPETEVIFEKKPKKIIMVSEEITLFGPTAPLKTFNIGTTKTDFKLEKRHSDTDLKASSAVEALYWDDVPVSKIQRAFSVGAFGLKKNRRLVPTRWSITAVDSILSISLMKDVRAYPWINDYQVYENRTFDNIYVVLLIPSNWAFEWLEAWFPQTFWNKYSRDAIIFADHEHYKNRTTYADTGGCYYSTRLAVAEKLKKMKRQGGAIVFREVHEGYLFPVGVWNVRENIRAALSKDPRRFNTLEEALKYTYSRLTIPQERWVGASSYLHELLLQKKITEYL